MDAHADDRLQQALDAVAQFQKASDQPHLADALYNVGLYYIGVRQYGDAEDYLRKSIAIEQTLHRHLTKAEQFAGKENLPQLVRDFNMLGYALVNDGKTDEAITAFNNGITTVTNLLDGDDRKRQIQLLNNQIAYALMQAGRLDEAQKLFLQLSQEATGKSKGVLLENLAHLYEREGKLADAISVMSQACTSLEDDNVSQARAYCELAKMQDVAGRADDALKSFQKAVAASDVDEEIANAEICTAKFFASRKQLTSALEHYSKAAARTKDAVQKDAGARIVDLYAQALNGQGDIYADLERFGEAASSHQQALELATQKNLPCKLDVASGVATDYLIKGDAQKALDIFTSTIDPSKLPLIKRANALLFLGSCYRAVGQNDDAIRLMQDAINIYHSSKSSLDEADATNALAATYLNAGQINAAEQLMDRAVKIFGTLEDTKRRALLDYNRAQAKLLRGKPAEAVPIFEGGAASLKTTGEMGIMAAIECELALACLMQKQYDKALSYAQQALDTDKSGSIESEWSNNLAVGKALLRLGRFDEAERYLKKAADLVEKERSALTRDSFKAFNLDLRRDCFYELVDLYTQKGDPTSALVVAERGKARAFLDMLTNRQRRTNEMLGKISDGGAPLIAMAPGPAGERAVSVITKGTALPPIDPTAISQDNAAPADKAEIKTLVSNRASTCVEFMAAGNKLYTWVLKPDGSITSPALITNTSELQQLVDGFSHTVTQTSKSQSEMSEQNLERERKLKRIYSIVIKPIEQLLPKDEQSVVTVIPDDYLFKVPFAALVDDKGNFLIEKHTLSYAPAVSVLRRTQKVAAETSKLPHKFLAFGDPITPQNAFLGDLSHAKDEVNKIYKLYQTSNTAAMEPLVKEEATKQKFFELAPTATEIHLATHGLVDEERPMQSSLVLAPTTGDSGRLTAFDVINLMKDKLKARLVVLSACETAKGKIQRDGVIGLSRAFIIAGTPSILVSQWNVDDVMTEFQMVKLYGAYLKGADKAKALRDAQIATIRFMENTPPGSPPVLDPTKARANPRYWAAFQLIGEFN
jgi:CHAT domain-containing protein/lipopolysaccharide biosynthesis regulator YciM